MPFFQTSDGLKLYFSDQGSGQPLLCLPGWTRNHRDFAYFADTDPACRLIMLDARGRGSSDFDPNNSNYNVQREALDVIELLDHLGLEHAPVLGTSRGGLVAMIMAVLDPDRLSGAILNDVGPVISAEGIAKIMDYIGRPPSSRTYDEAAQGMQHHFADQFPDVPLDVWRFQAEAQFIETDDGLDLRYDAHLRTALLEQAAAGPTPDLWPLFEALATKPLGLIRGANSDLLSADTAAEMLTRAPQLIFETVPNRGHVPFLNEPAALTVIETVLKEIK